VESRVQGRWRLHQTRAVATHDLALVTGVWSFHGTSPDGEAVRLEARNADVLRRQTDGTWRFVSDNPWGTD
jgi:ketosteroid isomerase-like protein